MAQSFARCTLCQNPLFDGKNKLAGGTFIEGNDQHISAPTTLRAPILAIVLAPIVTPPVVSGSANSFVIRFLEDNLQQIGKTIFKAKSLLFLALVPVPAPIVAAAPHYKGRREQLLKDRFSDIYQSKTHLEYYNFFQQWKDYFATVGATGPNQVPFTAIFLVDIALFRWQQLQYIIEAKTNVFISWEGFKALFCQNLGKSKAFVDTIWSIIRKNSQHQFKELMDCAAHLNHLQTVLCKFNADVVILKPVLIRLFHNAISPSIYA